MKDLAFSHNSAAKQQTSLLTLALRIDRINHNASRLAEMLARHPCVSSLRYPGLADHPGHETAKRQMTGFGGLLTFEVKDHVDLRTFQKALQLVLPANSMGEVATTLNSPFEASTSFRNPAKSIGCVPEHDPDVRRDRECRRPVWTWIRP